MGYYIREGQVEENQDLLENILNAVQKGASLTFHCKSVSHVGKTRNQINAILASSRVLIEECGGRYARLRYMVKVCEDLANRCVTIKPRDESLTLTGTVSRERIASPAAEPTEMDALSRLDASLDQTMVPLRFDPTDEYEGDDWLRTQCAIRGYDLKVDEVEGETFRFAIRSAPRPTAFDLLAKAGYTPVKEK